MSVQLYSIFSNIEDFESTFKAYRESTYSRWTIVYSKKNLNYHYKYIHHNDPTKLKTTSKGFRTNLKYIKATKCPAEVVINCSKETNLWVIKRFNDQHNHPLSKELYNQKRTEVNQVRVERVQQEKIDVVNKKELVPYNKKDIKTIHTNSVYTCKMLLDGTQEPLRQKYNNLLVEFWELLNNEDILFESTATQRQRQY